MTVRPGTSLLTRWVEQHVPEFFGQDPAAFTDRG